MAFITLTFSGNMSGEYDCTFYKTLSDLRSMCGRNSSIKIDTCTKEMFDKFHQVVMFPGKVKNNRLAIAVSRGSSEPAIEIEDREEAMAFQVIANAYDCKLYTLLSTKPWLKCAKVASKEGRLDWLKHLRANGCRWDQCPCEQCSKRPEESQSRYQPYHWLCVYAVINNHLNCLKYLHETGCYWDMQSTEAAAYEGHLECLKYLREQGCDWTDRATEWAASKGHLSCLMYLKENGCPLESRVATLAADGGFLDCLRYAIDNGCHCDAHASFRAAAGGYLECLKCLHDHGCPFDTYACQMAAENGHLECLKFMCRHWYLHETDECIREAAPNCAEYLRSLYH